MVLQCRFCGKVIETGLRGTCLSTVNVYMEVGSNGCLCLSVGAIPALAYVYMDTKAHNVLTPDRHHHQAFSAFAATNPHSLFHLSIIQYSAISRTMKNEKANL